MAYPEASAPSPDRQTHKQRRTLVRPPVGRGRFALSGMGSGQLASRHHGSRYAGGAPTDCSPRENPLGEGPSLTVPSRHRLSVGQELRGELLLPHAGSDLASYLARLPDRAEGTLKAYFKKQGKNYSCVIRRLHPSGLPEWEDASVPAALYGEMRELGPPAGVFYKTRLEAEHIREARKVGGLEALWRRPASARSSSARQVPIRKG